MSHVRTQIRHLFRDLLTAALGPEYQVESSRKGSRNATAKAFVTIRATDDSTDPVETQGNARVRVASVYVRVQRAGSGPTLDDALDADEVAVSDAILGGDWSDLLQTDPELARVSIAYSGEAGIDAGEVAIQFDCEYRVSRYDLETAIQ